MGNHNTVGNVVRVLSPIDQRKQNSTAWIRANPPNNMEKTTDYYNRYMQSNPNGCHSSEFGKLMKHEVFMIKKSGNNRYWTASII
jgi:hypothetical protein